MVEMHAYNDDDGGQDGGSTSDICGIGRDFEGDSPAVGQRRLLSTYFSRRRVDDRVR
jgi:hypothetical protein